MVHRLRTPIALPEVMSSNPSKHMVAHICNEKQIKNLWVIGNGARASAGLEQAGRAGARGRKGRGKMLERLEQRGAENREHTEGSLEVMGMC